MNELFTWPTTTVTGINGIKKKMTPVQYSIQRSSSSICLDFF